jgi:predicted nucleic-acid-binding protein
MLAIDTNVIVRYLVADDRDQAQQAKGLIDATRVFVAWTVLLETEWVLRRAYGQAAFKVLAALKGFIGLDTVTVEDETLIVQAFSWAEQGMDFAAALHLARASHCEAFVSFDRDLAKAARKVKAPDVREP